MSESARPATAHPEYQASLYPDLRPFDRQHLTVGDGHRLYVEQSGRADGVPVLTLHGGPGAGASGTMRRFFDPDHYRIILFDQRGSARSLPTGSITANTTAHLIEDIEKIRDALGLGQVILFGGSWGATLALAYAQAHPAAVRHIVLRGAFLGTQQEVDWLYRGGAGKFYPQDFSKFLAPVTRIEGGLCDPVRAYHTLLDGEDRAARNAAAAWVGWESRTASLKPGPSLADGTDHALSFARIENHYFVNNCFLGEDQLIHNLPRIAHIGADIVHGRYDMICPPVAAEILSQGLPHARLHLVEEAGHAMTEPGIAAKLVEIMDRLRREFSR